MEPSARPEIESQQYVLVICTTGLSDDQITLIHETARTVPVFFSANMSLGVALLAEQKQQAGETGDANALSPNYLRLSQAERERLEKQK